MVNLSFIMFTNS